MQRQAPCVQCAEGRAHRSRGLRRKNLRCGLTPPLFDSTLFPASQFADLYHQRWRIEEAFRRLKHRLGLEHVSGLSQLAVEQDVAAKVLCAVTCKP